MAYGLYCINTTLWLGHTITVFILSTPSIRTGPAWACYGGASCLLGQTWGWNIFCHCISPLFTLGAGVLLSFCPLSLSFFLLLSFQFLFRAIALSYHYSIKLGWYSASINFWVLFHLFLFWILPPTVSSYIYFLLLLFWTPVQTPSLFFLSIPTSLTLLLLLIPHPLLQILFWCLPENFLCSYILVVLSPSPPTCFLSRHLLILPAYMIAPTVFVLLLIPLLSSFVYTAYMLE